MTASEQVRTTTGVPISDTIEGRRYRRRNRLKVPGRRGGRHLSETPVGKQVIAEFIKPLVDRLTNIDPPGRLADLLGASHQYRPALSVPPEDLAQAILTPFLHGVFTAWADKRKPKKGKSKGKSSTARQRLSIAVGQYVHALLVRHKLLTAGDVPDRQKLLASLSKKRIRRKKGETAGKRGRKRNRDARNLTFAEWDRRDLAQVGDWGIEQAMALPCFVYDRSRKPYLPALSPEWMTSEALNRILAIKRYFIGLDDQQLPDFKPIPPWTAPVRGNLHRLDQRSVIFDPLHVALRAAEAGIPLTTNHDCFGTLAGDAADLNRIIRREFFLLHRFKWLVRLHEQNDPDGPLPPQRGWEFEDENSDGEYSWS
jgi:hypothetical protein